MRWGRAGEISAQLAHRAVPLGHDVVAVDRLEVDLAREQEVAVGEAREALEGPRERCADGVLDEARPQVRVLDDEELVWALEQLVDRRAHRRLDDLDETLRVQLRVRAHIERAAAALVVRRQRHELEDALDVVLAEARLEQALGRAPPHQPLGAGARVDPGRLHADDMAGHAIPRRRDPDQRDHLLRGEARHGSPPLEWVARDDPDFGAQGALALDDRARDVLGEHFDEQRLSDHDLLDRLLEELRKARHVHALLRRGEIDGAVDLGCDQLLAAPPPQPDRLFDALDARARKAELDVWARGLEIVCDKLVPDLHVCGSEYVLHTARLPRVPRPADPAGNG